MQILLTLIILIFSAIIHEVMHGVVAEQFGDDTARRAGRITLNPIPHIDPYGSILLPAIMLISTGGRFAFGAAKPVPVNFDRMRSPRLGMAAVSLAGPFSNLAIAFLLSLPITFGILPEAAAAIVTQAVVLNIILFVFNILPIPQLDGSKIIASLLPYRAMDVLLRFEQFGFIIILVLLFSGALDTILLPLVYFFVHLFGL